jgi:hypothetical protein
MESLTIAIIGLCIACFSFGFSIAHLIEVLTDKYLE